MFINEFFDGVCVEIPSSVISLNTELIKIDDFEYNGNGKYYLKNYVLNDNQFEKKWEQQNEIVIIAESYISPTNHTRFLPKHTDKNKIKKMRKEKFKINSAEDYANCMIHALTEHGVGCYIWHKATTGSVYIRFDDNRIGSVRIADHEGRSKLKYKYNLMIEGNFGRPKWVKDGERWSCYAHAKCYLDLCLLIVQQAEKVKSYSESKFSYTIPKFKQK